MNTRTREAESDLSPARARTASEPLANSPARGESGPDPMDTETAALEKVRELLFGEQVRETGDRLRDLEERLFDDTRRFHRETNERVENLGKDLYAKLDQLAQRIAAMEGAIQENHENSVQQIVTLREELAKRMAESTRASDGRLLESHEKAIAHTEQAAGALAETKMSRKDLATLFSEMASRVNSE